MPDIETRFRRHVDESAALFANDLATLLNRATRLGIAVCPATDQEGTSYSIEWTFRTRRYLNIDWDKDTRTWNVEKPQAT